MGIVRHIWNLYIRIYKISKTGIVTKIYLNAERYCKYRKIFHGKKCIYFNSRSQTFYAYIVGVHSVVICFCVGIYINKSHKSIYFLSRICQEMSEVNAFMLKYFKMIFQILEVWRCSFAYGYTSIGAINSVLSSRCFLLLQGVPRVLWDNISKCFNI